MYIYTVELWFYGGPRDCQNMFATTRFCYVFFSIYITITGVKKITCYTEDFVIYYRFIISRFQCCIRLYSLCWKNRVLPLLLKVHYISLTQSISQILHKITQWMHCNIKMVHGKRPWVTLLLNPIFATKPKTFSSSLSSLEAFFRYPLNHFFIFIYIVYTMGSIAYLLYIRE